MTVPIATDTIANHAVPAQGATGSRASEAVPVVVTARIRPGIGRRATARPTLRGAVAIGLRFSHAVVTARSPRDRASISARRTRAPCRSASTRAASTH